MVESALIVAAELPEGVVASNAWITLLPPLVAIALAIITRQVLISLGVGVATAALLIADFDVVEALRLLWEAFAGIFWADGEVNTFYVYILIFTLLLGVIAAFIMMSGGTRAFADWATKRIQTRRGAKVLPAILGMVIFIDDYFNALTVGQVSRPVTDAHRVSRAKLSYLVDSTSAPVAVLAPFSSWGAFIIGLMIGVPVVGELGQGDLEVFVNSAINNYYAVGAVLLVWLVVLLKLDIGPMRKEERRAIEENQTFDPESTIPGQLSEDLPVHHPGARRALVVPFVVLIVGVLAGIVWTGWRATQEEFGFDWIEILAATDVSMALLIGGLLGLAVAIFYYLRYTTSNPRFAGSTFGRAWYEGLKSMAPAVAILLLAWMLGDLIEQLGTGGFIGEQVSGLNISPVWLIPLIFLAAGAMAFATGTSWGSFGILLPIAGSIMGSIGETDLVIPAFGAVLAGAVFGDHASPISDTSILSATGSGANVITHVVTQLPYAGIGAVAAALGYVGFALTESTAVGLLVTVASVVGLALVARAAAPPLPEGDPSADQPAAGGAEDRTVPD